MKVLVTGAAGMIGSHLVRALLLAGHSVVALDRREGKEKDAINIVCDLADGEKLSRIVQEHQVDRVIHLAALAHTAGEQDLSYERYYHVNVECAKNVFQAAGECPVLFISTVDVFGFTKGVVGGETPLQPVTDYGKTKALAEAECKKICPRYTIFRFSPVYTPDVKRDIQKRYYLKYPKLAYIIGKGTDYEVLNIEEAVRCMAAWCVEEPRNNIEVIKDVEPMNTKALISQEKEEGRANTVLHFPAWLVKLGFQVLYVLTGKNKYTYLLNKAVNPLRTE